VVAVVVAVVVEVVDAGGWMEVVAVVVKVVDAGGAIGVKRMGRSDGRLV
jgi:hypothetical protein